MLQSSVTQKALYALNTIIFFLGVGLLSFSVYYQTKLSEFNSLRSPNRIANEDNLNGIYILPWVYVTIGVFAIINSVLGCFTTKVYDQSAVLCMSVSSSVFLILAVIMAFTTNLLTSADIAEYIKTAVAEIVGQRQLGIYEQWFTCCGGSNSEDYPNSQLISKYCCKKFTATDSYCPQSEAIQRVGCTRIIQRRVKSVNWGLFAMAMLICLSVLGTKIGGLKAYFKKRKQQSDLTSSTLFKIQQGQSTC